MNKEEYDDYMVDQAKEQAKEDRHNAKHTITLTGTEANLVMNYLTSASWLPESRAGKEIETLRLKFAHLYMSGKFE